MCLAARAGRHASRAPTHKRGVGLRGGWVVVLVVVLVVWEGPIRVPVAGEPEEDIAFSREPGPVGVGRGLSARWHDFRGWLRVHCAMTSVPPVAPHVEVLPRVSVTDNSAVCVSSVRVTAPRFDGK